ncbi:MAG TPA: hypothetical protein VLX58_19890, partial [Bryobacteraceae bacterium]|nr:hypothetical protein [Bryobacteraceae bacterium]
MDFTFSRDGATMIAVHAGYNTHGLTVVDRRTARVSQTIELDSAWIGMAWGANSELFISGGTGNTAAPFKPHILAFRYSRGALTRDASSDLTDDLPVT